MAKANFNNRSLFHGDNLDFLRGINTGTIDLIATDPPYNKGRDFHSDPASLAAGASFQDRWSWDKDIHQDWVDQIKDDQPAMWEVIDMANHTWGNDMGAYLCWLGVRLLEMKRVLKETGSIYLQCDQTAGAYIKCLMDSIFEKKNFRNQIIWKRTGAKNDVKKQLANNYDVIFNYTNSDNFIWNNEATIIPYDLNNLDEKTKKQYSKVDDAGRLYQLDNITDPHQHPPSNCTYEVMGVTRKWRWTKERMQKEIEKGSIVQTKTGNVPRYKRYLDEQQGKLIDTLWVDINNVQPFSKQSAGYPTQKPILLYERILKFSSNEGDMVLDPFCGCATTCVAAEKLKRQWVGIDIWKEAHKVVIDRLVKTGLAAPEGMEDKGGFLITQGKIFYSTAPPIRTDAGEVGAPKLKTIDRKMTEPPGPRQSRDEIFKQLMEENGMVCAGCDRAFDRPEYLELDHKLPRSDGGSKPY